MLHEQGIWLKATKTGDVIIQSTGAASAQRRTYYDSSGKVVSRSATNSQGSTTTYDMPHLSKHDIRRALSEVRSVLSARISKVL